MEDESAQSLGGNKLRASYKWLTSKKMPSHPLHNLINEYRHNKLKSNRKSKLSTHLENIIR